MSPNSAAYHTRARLRAESGEKSDAAEDYAAATHLEDEAREAFVGGTVSILDQLAEMRVALTSAVEALEQDDPDVDAHAESMEEYAQASRGLGTVPLKAVASVVGELSQRLITLYTIEDWSKTLEAADELILLDPNNALGHKVRCMTRITLGDIEGALQDADELVRVAPGDEYSYTTRAYLRGRTGRERQALEDYRLLLELDPESVSVRNSLADLLATATDDSVRDGARAVMYAEQVLSEADEVSHHHLDTLAAAFAELGQFDDAIRKQEECLRLMPDGEDQSQFLHRLELYRQGRPYRSSPG